MEHLDVQLARQYLRGRLTASEQQRWQQHAAGCPRCRELLESERSLMTVLRLGDAEPDTEGERALRGLADEVAHLAVITPAEARRRQRTLLMLLGVCVALLALLVWQVGGLLRGREAARTAADQEVQQVKRHLPALQALERDPWLRDYYETVVALEKLLLEARP